MTLKIAQVLQRLDSSRVLVVHGHDGLCELTVTAPTHVAELRDGRIREYDVNPEELGFKTGNLDEIRIDNPEESAKIIERIFSCQEQGTARDIALLNAAGALVVADFRLAREDHEPLAGARRRAEALAAGLKPAVPPRPVHALEPRPRAVVTAAVAAPANVVVTAWQTPVAATTE